MADNANLNYTIRGATEQDTTEIARLFTILGHPCTAENVQDRWHRWSSASDLTLVAAAPNGAILGVAMLNRMMVLHRPKPVGRITSLVVGPHVRGKGIGRALVAASEERLSKAGCGLLEITSNDHLVEAHSFYEHIGYERTSIRLVKRLSV